MTHHPRVHRSLLALVVTLGALPSAGCPASPTSDASGSGDATSGGEVPVTAEEIAWPDTPVTELARRETLDALGALGSPPVPVAFLTRLDVAYVDGDGADGGDEADGDGVRWVRLGVVLSETGLRVFDARPLPVTHEGYGEAIASQPLARLARAAADLPLLDEEGCASWAGPQVCEPLLTLAAEAISPSDLVGDADPLRLAAGDRALVGLDPEGVPVVVDLTVPRSPRPTPLGDDGARGRRR